MEMRYINTVIIIIIIITGQKPAVAIKEKNVSSKPSTPYSRPVGQREIKLPSLVHVRCL